MGSTDPLVVSMGGIGNTLMATPLIEKVYYGTGGVKSKVDVLVSSIGSKQILENNPFIKKAYILEKKLTKNLIKNMITILRLKINRYQKIVFAIPSKKIQYGILSKFLNCQQRISHRYNNKNDKWNTELHELEKTHDIFNNLNLDEEVLPKVKPNMQLYLTKGEEEDGKEYTSIFKEDFIVGVHIGSSKDFGMIEKRWNLENFAEIINKFPIKNTRFLIFLGEEDKELWKINDMIYNKYSYDIIDNFRIRKVASIIKNCDMFLSNDSGLMHIACCFRVPTIAIFKSTDYRRTYPFGDMNRVIIDSEPYYEFRQSLERLSGKEYDKVNYKVVKKTLKEIVKIHSEIKKCPV